MDDGLEPPRRGRYSAEPSCIFWPERAELQQADRTITVSKVNAAKAAAAAAVTVASATAEATAKDAQAKGDAAASAVEAAQAASNNAGTAAARTAIDAAQEAARIAGLAQAASDQAKLYATSSADIKQAPAGTAHITQLFQDDAGHPDLGDTQDSFS